jgi:hypothetical protein
VPIPIDYATIANCAFYPSSKEILFVSLRSKFLTAGFLLTVAAGLSVSAQQPVTTDTKKAGATPTPTPVATPIPLVSAKEAAKNPTAEQIAETSIFLYGLGGGRATLNQIRKTAIERGKISVANAEGKMEQASYQRFTTRGDTLGKDKIRLDQELPTARFSLVFSNEKIFGIFNDAVFTPRDDASRAFQNQIMYGVETLLRYKENESKLELVRKEKIGGVEMHIIDIIDKQNKKTRFYLSAKSFRVMILEYEDEGIKYRRKFYDYNIAQGTLFAFRTVLYAGDKIVEETDIGTVTYGQKIDDGLYSAN